MHIREATIKDAIAISGLIRPLAERYIAREFSQEGAANLLESMSPEAIERYFHSGYRYHIAGIDGQVIGVVGVRDHSHLYHLFVAEEHQKQGIARKLWHVTREACLVNDSTGIFTVNSSRFALGMYRKFGFMETGLPETKGGVVTIPMKLVINK